MASVVPSKRNPEHDPEPDKKKSKTEDVEQEWIYINVSNYTCTYGEGEVTLLGAFQTLQDANDSLRQGPPEDMDEVYAATGENDFGGLIMTAEDDEGEHKWVHEVQRTRLFKEGQKQRIAGSSVPTEDVAENASSPEDA